MRASKLSKMAIAIAAVLTGSAVLATESNENAFDSQIGSGEESLRDMGRYVTNLCRSNRLPTSEAIASDTRSRCSSLINAVEEGSPEDIARAMSGLRKMNSEESTSLQNTTLHIRNAQSGFRGRGDTASSISLTDNYNVPGAFGWSSGAAGDGASPWEVFINGLYSASDKDATLLAVGFESDDIGVTGGLSYNISDAFVMGVTLGYVGTDSTLDQDSGSLDADAVNYGVFASWYPTEHLYVDGMIMLNETNHDLVRNVRYVEPTAFGVTVDQQMLASMDSDRLDMSATVGYDFLRFAGETDSHLQTGFYARADYSDVDIDGYTETASAPSSAGAGLALAIDPQQFNSLTATGGLAFNGRWGSDGHPWYPYALFEFTHEFETNNDPISGRFAIDPDTAMRFRLPIDAGDRNYFTVGAGTTVALTDRLFGFFRYQGLIGYRGLAVHGFELGLRQTF